MEAVKEGLHSSIIKVLTNVFNLDNNKTKILVVVAQGPQHQSTNIFPYKLATISTILKKLMMLRFILNLNTEKKIKPPKYMHNELKLVQMICRSKKREENYMAVTIMLILPFRTGGKRTKFVMHKCLLASTAIVGFTISV
ncbi:hypothetical protein ACJX0J_025316 [Zea mays]